LSPLGLKHEELGRPSLPQEITDITQVILNQVTGFQGGHLNQTTI
jgi:hypothetical protein